MFQVSRHCHQINKSSDANMSEQCKRIKLIMDLDDVDVGYHCVTSSQLVTPHWHVTRFTFKTSVVVEYVNDANKYSIHDKN